RYVTIPVVRKTGGRSDTVNKKNGFLFSDYKPKALIAIIKEAIDTYANKPDEWQALIVNAMQCDYSWGYSAVQFIKLYENLLHNGGLI
ncbi:MAG: starch synthase, partial [Defluviitaleaceae bacterium]|nr:starch synthase [Defluviitaleaceae bacterium]